MSMYKMATYTTQFMYCPLTIINNTLKLSQKVSCAIGTHLVSMLPFPYSRQWAAVDGHPELGPEQFNHHVCHRP